MKEKNGWCNMATYVIMPGKNQLDDGLVRLTCKYCECIFDTNEFQNTNNEFDLKAKCPCCDKMVSIYSMLKGVFF